MKKLIAALMTIAILLSLCACGSAPKQKELKDFSTAELQEELMRQLTGEEEEEEVTSAQATSEVPPIEDYLVTIEITPENFHDYFEMITYPTLDDWGEPQPYYYFALRCNLNDQGLIYYRNAAQKADDDFLMEMKYTYYNGYGKLIESTNDISAYWLYDHWCMNGSGSYGSSEYDPEKGITAEVLRARGTLTFLKEDYIQEVISSSTRKTLGNDVTYETLLLKNGESMSLSYYADRKY